MNTVFSQQLRVLVCEQCGAPVKGTIAGGQVQCGYCGALNVLTTRDDTREQQAARHQPRLSEAQRHQLLRQQDGRPLLPPAALSTLLHEGRLTAQNEALAQQQWNQARREVAGGASFGAAERLYFLTMMLYGLWSETRNDDKIRALLETALNYLREPSHRAVLHGMLARNAARLNDMAAADHWLSLCDPYSEDIQTDSAYRLTAAYLATAKRDYARVLQYLGSRIDDVPIADNNDIVCGVLRANALEKTGQLNLAVQQLSFWTDTAGGAVQQVIAANAGLGLCFQSMVRVNQRAQQRANQQAQMEANVVQTTTGFRFGCLFLPLFLGGFAIPIILGGAERFLGAADAENIAPIVIGGYLVCAFLVVAVTLSKGARSRAHLKKVGIRGSATLISLKATGTQVNDQPQMLLRLKVEAPGQPAFIAEHREVISHAQLPQMVPGATMMVLYNPNDRAQLVIEE